MPFLITFWIALLPFLGTIGGKTAEVEEAMVAPAYCKIYGSVYLERDPKYRNTTSHTVFLNEEEAFAGLVVYREKNKLFADGTGLWYITPNKAFADYVLYVTDNRNLANFTVHFTDVRSYAGCRE